MSDRGDTLPGMSGTSPTPTEPVAAPTPEPNEPTPAAASADPPVTPVDPPVADPAPAEPPVPAAEPTPAKLPTVEEMLSDPGVARAIAEATKAEVAKAVKAKEAQFAKEQERAKMEESERLRVEKAEEVARAEKAEQEANDLRIDRDFNDAFLKSGARLENPSSLDFVRAQARKVLEAEGLGMEACVADVLEKHAYLLHKDPPPAPAAPASAPEPPQPPSTSPAPQARHTEVPAEPKAQNPVDTRKMTPQEYAEYRRETHGF